jgi:ribosomal protein L9
MRRMHRVNPGSAGRIARAFAASLLMAALPAPAVHAQDLPESDRQKAEEARKKAEVKANDEAYKETLKRTGVSKTFDPWGNVRTTTPSGTK